MSRRIILLSLVVLLTSGVAVAGDAPWFDLENCAMCKNVYDSKGLMENMTWEQVNVSNGIISITTVNKEFLPAYRKAHVSMTEIATRLQKGEQIELCGSCMALGACMSKGAAQEYVETSSGDVWLVTSDKKEVVDELQLWAKRNAEEAAKMKQKKES